MFILVSIEPRGEKDGSAVSDQNLAMSARSESEAISCYKLQPLLKKLLFIVNRNIGNNKSGTQRP